MNTKVIIADEQEVFRIGVHDILKQNLDLRVIGHFTTGNEVMDFLEDGGQADLILFNIDLAIKNGQTLLNYLIREFPKMKKLAVCKKDSEAIRDFCSTLEIDGIIDTYCSSQMLLKSVAEILKGNRFFQEYYKKTQPVLGDFYRQVEKEYDLTKREVDILKLILHQFENGEIAKKLNLSPLTIKTHRRNIFKKLKVRNLAGMVWLIKDHKELHRIF